MVDGGCGTWHVAGWQWVMARGAAAAHLQHSIWVTRPSNQPLQCCSAAVLQLGPAEDWSPGGCGASHNTPSVTKYPSTKIVFLLPLISFSAAFMELTCKEEHYLLPSFTLLSMIRLHIIFVQSILTISIWHDVSDSTEQMTWAGCSSWCWAGDTTAALQHPSLLQDLGHCRPSIHCRPAQPSPAHAVSSPQIMSDGVTALLHCSTAALQADECQHFYPARGNFGTFTTS